VLWRLHRLDEALKSVDIVLVRDSGLAEAWHSGGIILHDLGAYDGALAAYDKALTLKPNLVEAWLGRGNALRARKRFEEAFTAYDKALALKLDLAEAGLVAAMFSTILSAMTKRLRLMTRRCRSSLI